MIEHDIMRRVREWMAGGPPPHGLPFSSANLQTRGAQPRTALTKPPFSWIDHLIRSLQERRRDRQAEGLGGLEVDDQLEGCRLFNWQIRRLRPLEDPIDISGGAPEQGMIVHSIDHQAPNISEDRDRIDSRQTNLRREVDNPFSFQDEEVVRKDDECVGPCRMDLCKRALQIGQALEWYELQLHGQRRCCGPGGVQKVSMNRIFWITQQGHPREFGDNLFEQLQPFPFQLEIQTG